MWETHTGFQQIQFIFQSNKSDYILKPTKWKLSEGEAHLRDTFLGVPILYFNDPNYLVFFYELGG